MKRISQLHERGRYKGNAMCLNTLKYRGANKWN